MGCTRHKASGPGQCGASTWAGAPSPANSECSLSKTDTALHSGASGLTMTRCNLSPVSMFPLLSTEGEGLGGRTGHSGGHMELLGRQKPPEAQTSQGPVAGDSRPPSLLPTQGPGSVWEALRHSTWGRRTGTWGTPFPPRAAWANLIRPPQPMSWDLWV